MRQATASRIRLLLSVWILATSAVGAVRLWDLEDPDADSATLAGAASDDGSRADPDGGDAPGGAADEEGAADGTTDSTGGATGGDAGGGTASVGAAGSAGGSGGADGSGTTSGGATTGGATTGGTGLAGDPAPDGSAPLATLPPDRRPQALTGQIVFISNRGSAADTSGAGPKSQGYNIWTMAPDGSGQRALTTTGHDAAPALSPDGRRVAWVVADRELWVMRADGSNPTRLASCAVECGSPSWSSDGRRLAYRSHDGTRADVVLIGSDGSGRAPMGLVIDVSGVDWAPDGRRLAVSSTGPDRLRGLWVIEVDGSQKRQIVGTTAHGPSWSPTGDRILYSNGTDLLTVAAAGGDPRNLVTGSGLRLRGAWSADGTTIVYDRHAGQGGLDAIQVWAVGADGRSARQLTSGPGAAYQSAF